MARKVGEVARLTGRLVQVGTQFMADDNYPELIRLVHEGVIGKPMHVHAGYFRRGDWGERMTVPDADAKPGPDLDWEQFLGDAPKVPFCVSRFFQWRLTGTTRVGRPPTCWSTSLRPSSACSISAFPDRVFGGGGTFQYNREVPDQCNIIADYPAARVS